MKGQVKDLAKWKNWFAWYPITIHQGLRSQTFWLEWIQWRPKMDSPPGFYGECDVRKIDGRSIEL